MNLISAVFCGGGVAESEMPKDGLPEVAMIGRSNVGKSSLINHLTRKKELARTSSTPGKTQRIHFYLINSEFYLVDLPGYGYTKAPVSENQKWRKAIDLYLRNRKTLVGLCHLIDIRHPTLDIDMRVHEWVGNVDLPLITIFTKADKLSKNRLRVNLSKYKKDLEFSDRDMILTYSIFDDASRDHAWTFITRTLLQDRTFLIQDGL